MNRCTSSRQDYLRMRMYQDLALSALKGYQRMRNEITFGILFYALRNLREATYMAKNMSRGIPIRQVDGEGRLVRQSLGE